MRSVVLGTGFIGSNLVKFLKEKGDWVRAVDINLQHFRKPLWGMADEALQYCDLRRSAWGALKDVDHVYLLAADMGGRGFITDSNIKSALNNSAINHQVLEALQPEQRLFFAASACAYPDGIGPGEDRLHYGPSDGPYGEEKRHFTAVLDHFPNARVGILHTVYGPYQEYEGERMKFPTAITRKVIDAKKALRHRDNAAIEIWGDGTQTRTFLFIDDALEKIYRIMSEEDYPGPVNVGSDEEVTVKEIADALCKKAGIPPNYIFKPSAPTGPINRGCDNTLFNARYGKVNQTPAAEGFSRLHSWMKELL